MFILVRLTQHISNIIMLIVRGTDYTKKLRMVNVCNPEKNLLQAFTTRSFFVKSVLLTMSIMMLETCWV